MQTGKTPICVLKILNSPSATEKLEEQLIRQYSLGAKGLRRMPNMRIAKVYSIQ